MDMLAYRSIAAAAALFHMRHLELAPEGWRTCVERVAQGLCDQDGEKAFCLLCGGELCSGLICPDTSIGGQSTIRGVLHDKAAPKIRYQSEAGSRPYD